MNDIELYIFANVMVKNNHGTEGLTLTWYISIREARELPSSKHTAHPHSSILLPPQPPPTPTPTQTPHHEHFDSPSETHAHH